MLNEYLSSWVGPSLQHKQYYIPPLNTSKQFETPAMTESPAAMSYAASAAVCSILLPDRLSSCVDSGVNVRFCRLGLSPSAVALRWSLRWQY